MFGFATNAQNLVRHAMVFAKHHFKGLVDFRYFLIMLLSKGLQSNLDTANERFMVSMRCQIGVVFMQYFGLKILNTIPFASN